MKRANIVYSTMQQHLNAKLFALCMLIFTYGFGQNTTKITVFQAEDNTPTSADKANKKIVHNNIKWNYSLIGRGVFLFNYEYYLNEKLTAEGGFGLTYRDFVYETAKTMNSTFSFLEEGEFTSNIKYAVELGVRFYPKGFDSFEGVYISPMVSYRTYDFKIMDRSSYYIYKPDLNSFKLGYDFLDLQLKLGYQFESFWNEDLISDFYTGFSLRNSTVNYYEETQSQIGNNIIRTAANSKEKFPQFLFGFKIGVAF